MPHRAILSRIRSEYLEMPGLRLTLPQAQRLWGLERDACRAALEALVAERFLCARADGAFARTLDGPASGDARAAASTERRSRPNRDALPHAS